MHKRRCSECRSVHHDKRYHERKRRKNPALLAAAGGAKAAGGALAGIKAGLPGVGKAVTVGAKRVVVFGR